MREKGKKRVGREESRFVRGWNGGRRVKSARKSGIQWPVSSREGTYVMLDVNARERGKNGRGKARGGVGRMRGPTERPEAARVVVDEQWNTGTPQHRHISNTPLIPSPYYCPSLSFLVDSSLSLSHRLYFKRL